MPVKVYRRKGSDIYSYRGSVAGRRLRGSTGTTDKVRAERIAAEKETEQWKCHLDGPAAILTFAKAAMLYRAAGKETRFLPKIEDHWKDTLVKDIKAGAIKQMAIDLYPGCAASTINRQAIVPCQAVINHCADLEICPPIRVKRFREEKKIKRPVTLPWLETFLVHAWDDATRALAIFMFATGSRISNAMRLEWSDIDFQGETILFRKTKNKQERLAHIPPRLLVALANLPRDRKPFGRPRTTLRWQWDKSIERAAKAAGNAGFERLSFHRCRHGFATKLLRDGIDPKTAAWLGGWTSVKLFIETYAHEIQEPRLTDGIFDTELTRHDILRKKEQ